MKRRVSRNTRLMLLGLLALCLLAGSQAAQAVTTIYLRADVTTITLPGGAQIPIWGFARDTAFGSADGTVTLPGPLLTLPPGETELHIVMDNNLTPAATSIPSGYPVSLIIPGQVTTMTAVRFGPAPYPEFEGRIRSLTHETPPGNTTPVEYVWTGLKPGTYIYHSATHIQCQVQMGLYGGVLVDSAPNEAYPAKSYDEQIVLLYSEIDPAFHTAAATGNYGPGKMMTSTLNYDPKYFLINGRVFDKTNVSSSTYVANRDKLVLLRFLNCGLKAHNPMLPDLYVDIIAEDGKPYRYPKKQYNVFLPAGKTTDILLSTTATQEGTFALIDRMHDLTNVTTSPGGMLAYLKVIGPPAPPMASPDGYSILANAALNVPAPGVLGNDIDYNNDPLSAALVSGPSSAAAFQFNPNGSFSYQGNPGFVGRDLFIYTASDGTSNSLPTTVTLTVNDPPLAANDAYGPVIQGVSFTVAAAQGVLANDTDPNATPLSAVLVTSTTHGALALAADGSFTYTADPAYAGIDTFTYKANDGLADSAVVTVTITVERPRQFRTQFVKLTIPANSASVSVTAPAAFATVDPTHTLMLISGVTQHAMGRTANVTQTPNQISARVELTSSTLTANRSSASTAQSDDVWVLLIEYVGAAGGGDEFIVRDRRTMNWAATANSATFGPVAGIVNPAKVVVFNAGVENPNTGANTFNRGDVRSWLDAGGLVQLLRGTTGGAILSSHQVVEFIGANWSVQTGDTNPTGAGVNVPVASVGNVANAWIYFTWQENSDGVDERGHRLWLSTPTNLIVQESSTSNATKNLRWYVIANPNIRVQTGAANNLYSNMTTASITGFNPVADLTRAFAWVTGMTSGTGTQHPRDMWQFQLADPALINLQRGYNGATLSYRYYVVELP